MPDTRGTGESADASDPLSYRCDRLAVDVEALRAHLGVDRMDLLGHSAVGGLATLYAAAYPQQVGHLILLTPGLDAVGVEENDEQMARCARAPVCGAVVSRGAKLVGDADGSSGSVKT